MPPDVASCVSAGKSTCPQTQGWCIDAQIGKTCKRGVRWTAASLNVGILPGSEKGAEETWDGG